MKKEERLFAALGGVDPALLERSEKKAKRKHIWLPVGLAAAACAAIVLAVAPLKAEQAPLPVTPEPAPEDPVIDQPAPETLRLEGLEVGDLHLCQIQYGPAKTPDFVIYVNEEIYSISEEKGATVIRPKVALPETYPPIDLTITHRPGVSASLAAEQTLEELSKVYNQVFSEIATIGKGYSFTVGNGVKWDDAHATVTCVGDRQGGSFILTARYFTEATEGHGVRFQDMVGTFQVVTNDEKLTAPGWMNDLRTVTNQLTKAFFADRMGDVADLMTSDAWVGTYGEDVSGWISIANVDYRLDDDQAPTSAVVSVKHRTSTEDPYDYLTMELTRQNGDWLLTWAGLEK